MNVEAIEEASSCLQKVADNVKELVESENGIATILNDHRSTIILSGSHNSNICKIALQAFNDQHKGVRKNYEEASIFLW